MPVTRLDYTPNGGRQVEALSNAISAVGDTRITNGRAIEITLTLAAQNIAHGLGRPYAGWFFIDKTAACDAFAGTSPDASKYLTLTGTVATTATIWVF